MTKAGNGKMKMDENEILIYCKRFLENEYKMDLAIPIKVNGRLTRVLGRYNFTGSTPISIEISKKYLINGKISDIQSTLRHECIHYVLHQQNRAFKDGQQDFESELRKHNTNSTGTVSLKLERNVNVYQCECSEHIRKRALSNSGKYHSCTNCYSNLIYTGKKKMVF